MSTERQEKTVEKLSVATLRMPRSDYITLRRAALGKCMSLNQWCVERLLAAAKVEQEAASQGGEADGEG